MWTPLALAAKAATVAQLSAGRFVLGLGTGGYRPSFWESVGLPNRPIAVMRDYVAAVRALLAGETVSSDVRPSRSSTRVAVTSRKVALCSRYRVDHGDDHDHGEDHTHTGGTLR